MDVGQNNTNGMLEIAIKLITPSLNRIFRAWPCSPSSSLCFSLDPTSISSRFVAPYQMCVRTCLIEFEFELNCEFEFALVDSFTKTFLITLLLLILDQKGDFSLPHCTMRTANRRLQGSKRFQLYY